MISSGLVYLLTVTAELFVGYFTSHIDVMDMDSQQDFLDSMGDSGVELDLMSYIGADEDPLQDNEFYELQSKVVVGRWVCCVIDSIDTAAD